MVTGQQNVNKLKTRFSERQSWTIFHTIWGKANTACLNLTKSPFHTTDADPTRLSSLELGRRWWCEHNSRLKLSATKISKLNMFGSNSTGSEKCQLANPVANRHWQLWLSDRLRQAFPAILSNYNGVTACICRRFVPTAAFLVILCNCYKIN